MNWGNKLLVTFIVFGAGMSYLVYRSLHVNYEMVETDYYKNELRYQQVIDGSNRANTLSVPVKIEQTASGILLSFPPELKNKSITGEAWFYCAYDKTRDRKFKLAAATDGTTLLSDPALLPGSYTVKLTWAAEQKGYYNESAFIMK
jgi:hypothetical protein